MSLQVREVYLNATTINLTGEQATITGASLGSGDGGDLNLNTAEVNLKEQSSISVSASAQGNAGNIALTSGKIHGDRGRITAESAVSGGGDISLTTTEINLNNDSLISTSVQDSNGGGGNILINNQELILLRNNSDIRANAFAGPGGNINISTNLLFRNLDSDIDASSRFGLDGTVEVTTIESDKELAPVALPENIQDPTAMITGVCPVADENSFAFVGNGGIPPTPADTGSVQSTWTDLRTIEANQIADTSPSEVSQEIYEADRVVTDASGEVYLMANKRVNRDRWSQNDCQS